MRDELLRLADENDRIDGPPGVSRRLRALAEKCAEPVGLLTIEHFRGVRAMENVDFEYTGQLEPGTYRVYVAPLSQPVALPDGWVAVPREPTEEHIADALSEASTGFIWDDDTDATFPREFAMAFYRAMLAAAPAGEGVPK